jgi:hypothetical protein
MKGVDSLDDHVIVISRCDFHARQSSVMLLLVVILMETGFHLGWNPVCIRNLRDYYW